MEERIKKIEELLNSEDDMRMDNWIWILSILMLGLYDNDKPIINIYIGDE